MHRSELDFEQWNETQQQKVEGMMWQERLSTFGPQLH